MSSVNPIGLQAPSTVVIPPDDPSREAIVDFLDLVIPTLVTRVDKKYYLGAQSVLWLVRYCIQFIIMTRIGDTIVPGNFSRFSKSLIKFFDAYYAFCYEHNSAPIHAFLQNELAESKGQQSIVSVLKKIGALFELGDPLLFGTLIADYKEEYRLTSEEDKKMGAAVSISLLCDEATVFIDMIFYYIVDTLAFLEHKDAKEKSKHGETAFFQEIRLQLQKLDRPVKYTVAPLVRRIIFQIGSTDGQMVKTLDAIQQDFKRYYTPILSVNNPIDSRYISKHQGVFRNFFPRISELYSWLNKTTRDSQRETEDFFGVYFYLRNEGIRELPEIYDKAQFRTLFAKKIRAVNIKERSSLPLELKTYFFLQEIPLNLLKTIERFNRVGLGTAIDTLRLWQPFLPQPQKRIKAPTPSFPVKEVQFAEEVAPKQKVKKQKQLSLDEQVKLFNTCFTHSSDAMQNAHRHFNLLILHVRSLPMQESLSSWSMRCIEHSSLFLEQLLRSLIANPPPKLSHDLVDLLNLCTFNKLLSAEDRETIADLNGGEIAVRFPGQEEGNNQLDRLLIAPASKKLELTLNYLEDVFDLGFELSRQWTDSPLDKIRNEANRFWQSIRETSLPLSWNERSEPLRLQIQLHQLAERLLSQKEPLLNLSDNLVERIAQASKLVDPAYADALLIETCLVGQLALEALLIIALDVKGDYVRIEDHHLEPLVEKLKLSLTEDEKSLIKRGSFMRQLLRYPARFFKEKTLSKWAQTLHNAVSLSRKYASDAGQDFTGFHTNLSKADQTSWNAIREMVSTERNLLLSISAKILTCIEEDI